jgi:formate-dependent nitrite reductase membrane component NrfD
MIRTNPGVDPAVDVWAWQIPIYLFLGGLTAGLMVIGAAMELRRDGKWEARLAAWGAALSAAMLSLGMLALFLDLAHKWYVYRFYLAFRPASPMSWGAWILVAAYPALALWFLGSLGAESWGTLLRRVPPLRVFEGLRGWSERNRRLVLAVVAMVGTGLGTYTGILLQTLGARPLWNTGLLGPLFLASGLSGGAAVYVLLRPGGVLLRGLLAWDVSALLVEAALLALFLVEKGAGGTLDRLAAGLLLAGPYTGTFFGLVVLAGIAAPLLIELVEMRRGTGGHLLAAPLLVLLGGISLRAVLVAAGLVSSFSMLQGG